MNLDPKTAAEDPEIRDVLEMLSIAESFSSTPLFPSVSTAERRMVLSLQVAADELRIMRQSAQYEASDG